VHLFVDCETSDLPGRWNAPITDLKNWPRVVQLAWILCDGNAKVSESRCHLIVPDGFKITYSAFQVHGITTERATSDGLSLVDVLDWFQSAIERAEQVIAHNIQFDASVIGAEFLRAKRKNPFNRIMQRCTMLESTDYCKIASRRGYKWPRLEELFKHLFCAKIENAHDAAADCLACMQCFYRLRELKAII
jgi:DNA polymerase III subunit epsilon